MQGPQAPYKLHDRLGYQLSKLSKQIQARLESGLSALGMSRLQWCVLSAVGLEGLRHPSALADHIGITRPATSRLLVQMRKSGLIAQAPDGGDGRARQIVLTAEGQQKLAACRVVVDENERHFAGKLGAGNLAKFKTLITLLADGEAPRLSRL